MAPEPAPTIEDPSLGKSVRDAIDWRYGDSGAERYGLARNVFRQNLGAVILRYGGEFTEAEKLELIAGLHVDDLVLVRACSAGNDLAWSDFLHRFRAEMRTMACQITRDDMAGRELADGLYAELYGLPNREGRRISKLDYYMGRGSLKGWLRTLLAQQHVNRYRSHAKDVSLEEQVESGIGFAAKPDIVPIASDGGVAEFLAQSLAELDNEERFLLVSYYLDRRALADIGRQLRVHESTVSRKLDKVTRELQKRIRKRMNAAGVDRRRCDEIMRDLDVRDLNVDVEANLRQERPADTF
jgi:RNA polymerase sigma-70 factor (ECF subfamily)